ncbi:hypothetical protein ElyMa_006624300 [Elysia marginata]|uniref:Uncharacterized protein n=1 Tax=Elysia marginata TaxID=1093978 RepID=A0AAV4II21_9GAST|nr:hypothetical protein ElyMa_006624300 [Elysia marginata]
MREDYTRIYETEAVVHLLISALLSSSNSACPSLREIPGPTENQSAWHAGTRSESHLGERGDLPGLGASTRVSLASDQYSHDQIVMRVGTIRHGTAQHGTAPHAIRHDTTRDGFVRIWS